MTLVAPSILAADFGHLARDVQAVEAAGADWLHIDVMDGHFVPNLTLGPPVVAALRGRTRLLLDVHLMVERPETLIPDFQRAGADLVTVHAEVCPHLHRVLQTIRGLGMRAGVSFNPATPLAGLEYVLDQVDLVLVMSVNPGFGGQEFIPSSLDKLRQARALLDRAGCGAFLQVDGGVNLETARACLEAGADVLVAGSFVFGSADPAAAVAALKNLQARQAEPGSPRRA
ncbi:MAG: ribulose-phosphate 3-epimerase [Syntrophomonadaceae bacterium]|jgi:ribulose-phosphate 3-epimerase|nr:ribulose-phosphate 3-epimerase [Syntrophomonadaceae bacterium]MDH7497542.1 ribulose-phosphate 3-epimerase [Syntrophomonadaceae bacterium]